jgi:hypothetical protein
MLQGATDEGQGTTVRSEVETGPPLVRQRYTAEIRHVDIPVDMSAAERVIFEEFRRVDLNNGVIRFTWIDPIDGEPVSMRFRSTKAPKFTMVGGGDAKRFSAVFEMEILP